MKKQEKVIEKPIVSQEIPKQPKFRPTPIIKANPVPVTKNVMIQSSTVLKAEDVEQDKVSEFQNRLILN